MKFLKKLDEKYYEFKNKTNLSKKNPKWVNKKVSRSWLVLVFLSLFLIFGLSGWDASFLSYKCADSKGCLNPFYNMPEGVEGYSCDELRCDSEYVPLDFEVDSTPPFVKNYVWILFGTFLLIFPISRVLHALKFGE